MLMRKLVLLAALLAAPIVVRAQAPDQPDRRGEAVLSQPVYQGERASAPIPPAQHIRNEGGSDGQGLCVLASIIANGMYQGVQALLGGKDSALWRHGKSNPGGYHESKLEAAIARTVPGERYLSYLGPDTTVLDRLSQRGYPIGATMNTGRNYGYRRIAHMISLLHYREGGLACVLDNNFIGKYSWMPAAEFARRWKDGNTGWAFIWTRQPPSPNPSPNPTPSPGPGPAPMPPPARGAATPLLCVLLLLLVAGRRRRLARA